MKIITRKYKVYTFNELNDNAQQKAIEKIAEFQTDYEWWDSVYEDAKTIGLKITEFELDRGSYAKGEFINNAKEVAESILENHGESCETYKTAQIYLNEYKKLIPDENGEVDSEDIDNEFKRSLLEDYRIMLQHEYEYLNSEESIKETIEANNYQFTEDGKLFSS